MSSTESKIAGKAPAKGQNGPCEMCGCIGGAGSINIEESKGKPWFDTSLFAKPRPKPLLPSETQELNVNYATPFLPAVDGGAVNAEGGVNGSGGDSEALKSAEQGVERGGLGGGSWGGGEGKEGVEVFGKIEKRASTESNPEPPDAPLPSLASSSRIVAPSKTPGMTRAGVVQGEIGDDGGAVAEEGGGGDLTVGEYLAANATSNTEVVVPEGSDSSTDEGLPTTPDPTTLTWEDINIPLSAWGSNPLSLETQALLGAVHALPMNELQLLTTAIEMRRKELDPEWVSAMEGWAKQVEKTGEVMAAWEAEKLQYVAWEADKVQQQERLKDLQERMAELEDDRLRET